ncbi:MAG: hypothetical protein Q8N82_02230, partial [Deltaproteobacteria bacterium]|nr:hypothetical protein [Deltaproteobacteria bacterium]
MVFQAVRTRFPLRIAEGMTELGLLQEPHILNPDNLRASASRTETIQIQCLFCKEKDRAATDLGSYKVTVFNGIPPTCFS